MSGIPPPQPSQAPQDQAPQGSYATQYAGPYLNEYIPYDEHHGSVTSSDDTIVLSFKADNKNYDYLGTVLATIIMPEIKIGDKVPIIAAWPQDAIPLSIDCITMSSPSISAGQVSYTITGEQVAKNLHHYRNFDNCKNEVMGNIPELLEFSRYIPSYPSTIKLPVFWNNYHPFPLNLCKEDITITVKLKSPKDLLRLRAIDSEGNTVDVAYNNPSTIDKIYEMFSVTPSRINGELEYRVSKCPGFTKEPDNLLYQHRLLPRFLVNTSGIESINGTNEVPIDNLDCNVLGFMWHLQPVYLDSSSKEINIHAYGNYSLDPLMNSKYDPINMTEITITRTNGTIEPVIKIRGTSSRLIDSIGLSEPMSVGHHIYTFGTNPFEGFKYTGKDIKRVTFKCTSSDRFVSSTDNSTTDHSDIMDIIMGVKKTVVQRDAPIDLNLSSDRSTHITMSTSSIHSNAPPPPKMIAGIGYKLVVHTIISTEMNIKDGKVTFK